MDKWQMVILEWVNCLKIADPITNVSSLSKNNFFKGILCKLCKDDSIDKLDQSMVQDKLYQFIRDSYPDYKLAQDGAVTTDNKELTYICSLLMYYCAIQSEDPSLRDPPCNLLSETSQKLYMMFLRSILDHNATVVTRELVCYAIKESCNKLTHHKLSPQRPRSTENVRVTSSSNKIKSLSPPIPCFTDFIQSPEAKKQKHLEYVTREMRILKAELETERDERLDLQEEIKRQNETIFKLTKDLERKQNVIDGLNSQILDIEQEKEIKPPKTESNIIIKLRNNLKDAEKRIENLQNELAENEKENKSLTYKLSSVKSECQLYQQKYDEYEIENNALTDLTVQKTNQITNLTTEINELRNILTEYQTKNTSAFSDSYTMSEPENLGVAVIELQLKEIENENIILKQKNEQLTTENSHLQQQITINKLEIAKQCQEIHEKSSETLQNIDEIKCMQKSLDKLNAEFKILQNKHSELADNYEIKKHECEKLTTELAHNNNEYQNKVEQFEEELVKKHVIIEHKEMLLEKAHEEMSTLKSDIELKLKENENQTKQIFTLTKSMNEFEMLQDQYNELLVVKENLNEEIHNLKQDLSEKCENLDVKNQDIHILSTELNNTNKVIESIQVALQAKDQDIHILTAELRNANEIIESNNNTIETLTASLGKLEIDLKNVQNEHETLKITYVKETTKTENLTKLLRESKTRMEDLEKSLQSKTQCCANFERKSMNNLALIEVLNKEIMKLQSNISEKKGEIASLSKHIDDLKKQLKHDKIIIRDHDKKLNEYNSVLDSKSAFINKLESQLSHVSKTLKESESKVSEKNKTINNLEIMISNYETEINDFKLQLDDNDRHITNLNVHEEEMIRKYEKDIDMCNKTVTDLKASISELEILMQTSETEKQHLEMEITTIHKEKETLLANLHQYGVNLENLRVENEKILTEKNNEIISIQSENMRLKENLDEANQMIHHLKESYTLAVNQKNSLSDNVHIHMKNLENLQNKYETLHADCQGVKEMNQNILTDNQTLSKYVSELKHSNMEMNTELLQLKRENEQLCVDLKKFNTEIENLEKQYQEVSAAFNKTKTKLEKFKSDNKQLTTDKNDLEMKLQQFSIDLSNQLEVNQQLQDENHLKINELIESQKLYDDLTLTTEKLNEKYTNEITSHMKKSQDLENEKKNLINTNIALNDKLTEMETNFDELTIEYNREKENFNELTYKLKQLHNEYQQITSENTQLTQKIESSNSELKRVNIEKEELFKKVTELEQSNIRIRQEIVDISNELELQKTNYEKLLIDNNILLEEKEIFSSTISGLETKIIESDAKINELNADKIDLRNELTEIQSVNIEKFSELTVELTEKIDMLTQLELENNRLIDENTEVRNKFDKLSLKHNTELENHEKHVQEYTHRIEELNKDHAQSLEKYLNIEKNYTQVVIREENLLKEILVLKNQISELQDELSKSTENSVDISKNFTELEEKYKSYVQESEKKLKITNEKLIEVQNTLQNNEKLLKQLESTNIEMETEVNQRTKLIMELREQIEQLKNENTSKVAENEKLNKECIDLKRQFDEEKTNLIKNYQTLKAEYEESRNFTQKIISEKDILIEKASEFENRNLDLNSELLQTKKELLIINGTYGDLEKRYKTLESENIMKIQHLEEQLQAKSEEFTRKCEQSQKDLEILKESTNSEKQDLEKLLSQKEQLVIDLSEDIRGLKGKIELLDADKLNLSEKLVEFERKYSDLLSSYTNLEQSKKMIEIDQEQLKTDNVQLQEKMIRLEAEKLENEKVMNKKDRLITDLERITTNLKDEITKLVEKNVMLIKEIDILKNTLTTVENENKTLAEKQENSQQKFRKLLNDKEKEIEESQKECKLLEKKVFDIENEKMKVLAEKNRVQDEMLSIKTSRDQLLTKHSDMSNQLEEYIHKNFELRKQIEKLEKQITYEKDSRSEIQQMLRKQTDISEKSQEYVKQNVELSKKIENLEKMLRIESENCTKNEKAIKEQIKTAAKDVQELQSQIGQLNHENAVLKTEKENLKIENLSPRPELIKLREAYEQVVSENSQLQYDLNSVRKTIAEKEIQLGDGEKLKEAYEKLFKDNDTLKSEFELLKEKRMRDKEEFKVRLEQSNKLKEEKMRELRIDYDVKLEKMKGRMKQLYAEEVAKSEKKKEAENEQLCKSYKEKIQKYEEYIKDLQSHVWTVGDKFLGEQQDKERMHKQLNDAIKRNSQVVRHDEIHSYPSHESLQNAGRESLVFREKTTTPLDVLFGTNSRDSLSNNKQVDKRDSYLSIGGDNQNKPVSFIVSLPSKSGREKKTNRVGPITQEFKEPNPDQQQMRKRITRNPVANIGQGLHMEDEEVEMFNTNYLSDLQSGRCVVTHVARPSSPKDGGAGNSSADKTRLTELQVRNSLCPPHLKSSYPAETQFHSPNKFKEDDLKTGNVHLDDSLNTCLLPDEKPRRKESTFYKKPGPSTPSKRSSFQGTESREILREQNTETVNNTLNNRKSSTPNRIMKVLFPNRSNTLRADTENQPVTPRNRRYSIFRKQR